MKNCTRCSGRFDRIPVAPRRLKDGSRLDVSTICPSCESLLIKESQPVVEDFGPSAETLDAWNRECLRKDAFAEAHIARKVAKRMRRAHRGAVHPVDVYRCRVTVDPIMFPDRAASHWHIGGR